ncbi:tRNA (adenosine(37)-N6)-threonylcarbamoyltransferase complex transferase subunit TsaD [Candidatus Beckwithbacteria bacterium]|nr:tRNA (adenosine(37)-N6)-threonylcarbamoyltransferase complex transferase subunit TsaD [Candidatus Beckwithbacteria bacterium]
MSKKYPIILSFDTSCDDTSVAITQGMRVLSNIVASQEELHRKYGGVMPLVAKLAHHEQINPAYQEALKRAHVKPQQIDVIAVTYGPGLAIALEVGLAFAKELAQEFGKPLIAVNHMAGHLYSVLAQNAKGQIKPQNISFPVLALLASGGHTELLLLTSFTHVKKIGQTIDDAAGEALDKFARLIDLGYPGAAALEQIAKQGNGKMYQFPLPMTKNQNLDFSFSGLKTAGRHQIEELQNDQSKTLSRQEISNLAASFQAAVFRAIIYKLKKAIKLYQPKTLWLGGGVSNNTNLRSQLRQIAKESNLDFQYPYSKKLMSDNAAMIGTAAYLLYEKQDIVEDLEKLHRQPRLSL